MKCKKLVIIGLVIVALFAAVGFIWGGYPTSYGEGFSCRDGLTGAVGLGALGAAIATWVTVGWHAVISVRAHALRRGCAVEMIAGACVVSAILPLLPQIIMACLGHPPSGEAAMGTAMVLPLYMKCVGAVFVLLTLCVLFVPKLKQEALQRVREEQAERRSEEPREQLRREEEIRIVSAIEFRRTKRKGSRWAAFCPQCHIQAGQRRSDLHVFCGASCGWLGTWPNTPIEAIISQLEATNTA